MAWGDVHLDVEYLKGLARFDQTDPGGDPIAVDSYIEKMARDTIKQRVTVKMGAFVLSQGGQDTFFDALSALAVSGQPLYEPVQRMLGFAYLHHWARSENLSIGHRLLDDSVYYDRELQESVAAFSVIAPKEIVTAGETTDVRESTGTVTLDSGVTFT